MAKFIKIRTIYEVDTIRESPRFEISDYLKDDPKRAIEETSQHIENLIKDMIYEGIDPSIVRHLFQKYFNPNQVEDAVAYFVGKKSMKDADAN